MAITGTKYSNASKTLRNYFVNDTTITDVEVMDSQYADLSLKLLLEDDNNGYTYTCFVNQKFDKDTNGVVTGLTYPDDLNTLFVAAKCRIRRNASMGGVAAYRLMSLCVLNSFPTNLERYNGLAMS